MPRQSNQPSRIVPARGFTLIELMITIAIAAVLLAIAVPSFRHVMSQTSLSGTHNDLIGALRYARTEAVTRGVDIAVAASSSGNWTDGWTVKPAGAATVLRRHAALGPTYTITLVAGTPPLTFNAQGASSQAACFTLTDTRAGAAQPLHIAMLPSGSIHSQTSCL